MDYYRLKNIQADTEMRRPSERRRPSGDQQYSACRRFARQSSASVRDIGPSIWIVVIVIGVVSSIASRARGERCPARPRNRRPRAVCPERSGPGVRARFRGTRRRIRACSARAPAAGAQRTAAQPAAPVASGDLRRPRTQARGSGDSATFPRCGPPSLPPPSWANRAPCGSTGGRGCKQRSVDRRSDPSISANFTIASASSESTTSNLSALERRLARCRPRRRRPPPAGRKQRRRRRGRTRRPAHAPRGGAGRAIDARRRRAGRRRRARTQRACAPSPKRCLRTHRGREIRPRTAGQRRSSARSNRPRSPSASARPGPAKRFSPSSWPRARAQRPRSLARHPLPPRGRSRREASDSCPATSARKSIRTCARSTTRWASCSTTTVVQKYLERGTIEVAPLAFMRGRTPQRRIRHSRRGAERDARPDQDVSDASGKRLRRWSSPATPRRSTCRRARAAGCATRPGA